MSGISSAPAVVVYHASVYEVVYNLQGSLSVQARFRFNATKETDMRSPTSIIKARLDRLNYKLHFWIIQL